MAVQKSRKSRSKTGMHRSHQHLQAPCLSVDPTTGETHLRHCITPDGYYRGKQVIFKRVKKAAEEEKESILIL